MDLASGEDGLRPEEPTTRGRGGGPSGALDSPTLAVPLKLSSESELS